MAIRLRKIKNQWIALCAYETNEQAKDIYIDDAQHYALACKFAREHNIDWEDKRKNRLMDSQKVRDANNRID